MLFAQDLDEDAAISGAVVVVDYDNLLPGAEDEFFVLEGKTVSRAH